MNNDLISREALRNVILNDRKLDGVNANWEVNRILVHIDNAQTVPQINIFCENADEKAIADMKEELQKVINDIRPQDEWIPISERLPEERINPYTNDFENVLCSTVWGDVRTYNYGKPKGYNKAHFWHGGKMDEYVIAWQPLPEPYKKGGAE